MQALQARYGLRPIEINCYADGPTLLARFQARACGPSRHPGHVETGDLGEWTAELLRGSYPDLALGGLLLRVDTTDFATIDYPAILRAVKGGIGVVDAANAGQQPAAPVTPAE